MARYAKVKSVAVDLVDDFTKLDLAANYGSKYTAKTKLTTLGVNPPVKSVMPPRTNKRMRQVAGSKWKPVGAIDVVQCNTVGEFILLCCGQSGTTVPMGEPT